MHRNSSATINGPTRLGMLFVLLFSGSAQALTMESRTECHAAVERHYWEQRIWPAQNPQAKPRFEDAVSATTLLRRAQDALAMSVALEALWGERIDATALQREVERMARESRDPKMLGRIFAALDDDPALVRECLARPRLAERRLRHRYETDNPGDTFSAWWNHARGDYLTTSLAEARVQAEVAGGSSLPDLPEGGVSQPPDSWSATPALPRNGRDLKAVWTGSEFIAWGGSATFHRGGRYDPALDLWTPLSVEGEPSIRSDHTLVWTGTEVIAWGGWGFINTTNVRGDGAAYDPVADTWRSLSASNAPSPRSLHSAVWTGSEMIVWGGCSHFQCFATHSDGASYDPGTDSWTALSATGAPSGRGQHTAVWTGDEMLIWGGNVGGTPADSVGDGYAYDPAGDTWRTLSNVDAPADRHRHTAVWTGSEMIVWGGLGDTGLLNTGGRYDPLADSWQATDLVDAPFQRVRHIALWTGDVMIVWGGCRNSECSIHVGGSRYDPADDSWAAITESGSPGARSQPAAVWTGDEMIIHGGCSGGECQISRNDGGRYDPAADSWVVMDLPDNPGPRINHTAVWTGSEMIVWGGFREGSDVVLTGSSFDPATNTWTPTAIDGVAAARDSHTAVWTGTEMIIWGGRVAGIGTTPIGARYNPASDTWVETTTTEAPDGRAEHTAVWTGTEMVVWGGCQFSDCQSFLSDGGRYDPDGDSWSAMSSVDAPSARFLHTAVLADGEMIVWGGLDGSGVLAAGGRYDPLLDDWSAVAAAMEPAPRAGHTAVTTGSEMIIWGGNDGENALGSGARYHPDSDSWTALTSNQAPPARTGHVAVWDGSGMLVWSGCDAVGCTQFGGDTFFVNGARYAAANDSWAPINISFAPLGRELGSAVWTGERMIAWGGWRGGIDGMTASGGVYRPVATLMFKSGFEAD